MASRINLIQAKTIFTKSGLPGSDWVINPYNGCLFGCLYCYAAQIARWKHPDEKWGTYLDVKINASELLKTELEKLHKKLKTKNFGSVFFSSVTDPYVGLEAKYQITRKCLEVLADFDYRGKIAIQTKSPLVTRDIDVFKRLKNVEVGFTITSLDDKVSRFLEVNAPPASSRFDALRKLHQAGIPTYAFVGPILPHYVNNEKIINQLLDKLQKTGVKEVWFEHINLAPKIKARLYGFLKKQTPALIPEFETADTEAYRDKLDKIIHRAMKNRNLKMGLGKVIYHHKLPKKNKNSV
jgi:DNA repair photolyase